MGDLTLIREGGLRDVAVQDLRRTDTQRNFGDARGRYEDVIGGQ